MREQVKPWHKKPWKRRESETSKSYAAFCLYLELGVGRSIRNAHKMHREREGLPPIDHHKNHWWRRWCSEHDWVSRALAYDEWVFEERLARAERNRDRARVRLLENVESMAVMLLKMAAGQIEEIRGSSQLRAVLAALALAGMTLDETPAVQVIQSNQSDRLSGESLLKLAQDPEASKAMLMLAEKQAQMLIEQQPLVIDVAPEGGKRNGR